MASMKLLHVASLAVAMSIALNGSAQTYSEKIEQNPDRAGGVYHYYEYVPTQMSKAPKGYKPFYISHYGRHGSRYHSSARMFEGAKKVLERAEEAGILTDEGMLLKRQVDTLWNEHLGMFGMLTERGAAEHKGIASRMFENYPEVFEGKNDRSDVECVSSYWPRCLVSMANCTSVLQSKSDKLRFHYVTGPKYLNYISMDLDTKEVSMEADSLCHEMRDRTIDCDRFMKALFTDQEKAAETVENPQDFMEQTFLAGSISGCTISHPGIFSHFTVEELTAEAQQRDARLYYVFGISKERGDYEASIAKPLIEDFIAKADDAVKEGSTRAADLRFGHDVGLLPLIGTINIKGMEERWSFDEIKSHWTGFEMIPMGSNIQIVFYRNSRNDVIVKILYNDRETSIPALTAMDGPFYRWDDLRSLMVEKADAIPDNYIVKDDANKERTGVSGM